MRPSAASNSKAGPAPAADAAAARAAARASFVNRTNMHPSEKRGPLRSAGLREARERTDVVRLSALMQHFVGPDHQPRDPWAMFSTAECPGNLSGRAETWPTRTPPASTAN